MVSHTLCFLPLCSKLVLYTSSLYSKGFNLLCISSMQTHTPFCFSSYMQTNSAPQISFWSLIMKKKRQWKELESSPNCPPFKESQFSFSSSPSPFFLQAYFLSRKQESKWNSDTSETIPFYFNLSFPFPLGRGISHQNVYLKWRHSFQLSR